MAWYNVLKSATYGVSPLAGHDPVEGLVTGLHLAEVEAHLPKCGGEDDIQAAAAVNQHLGQQGLVDGGRDDRRV